MNIFHKFQELGVVNKRKLFLQIDIGILIIQILASFALVKLVHHFALNGEMAVLIMILVFVYILLPYLLISYVLNLFIDFKFKQKLFFKQRLVLLIIYSLPLLFLFISNSLVTNMGIKTSLFVFFSPFLPLFLSIFQLFVLARSGVFKSNTANTTKKMEME